MRFTSIGLDYQVSVHRHYVLRHGMPRDPLGQEMVPARQSAHTLRARCRKLIRGGSYSREDVRALIAEWDAERGIVQEVDERRARELERLTLRSLGYVQAPSLLARCRELLRSNPDYKLADVKALIAEWDAERGMPKDVTNKRAWMLVSKARETANTSAVSLT